MTGKLYVVGTPIGNLSDFSPRAAECLRNCDFIAAEDTRVTLKLLNRFDIKKPLISYFEHNRRERGETGRQRRPDEPCRDAGAHHLPRTWLMLRSPSSAAARAGRTRRVAPATLTSRPLQWRPLATTPAAPPCRGPDWTGCPASSPGVRTAWRSGPGRSRHPSGHHCPWPCAHRWH